jgi:translation initiation factor 2 subunit 1
MMHITRFYKKEFPDQDDCVMVKINKENEYGYNCALLEYGNMEGFLPLSELDKKKYVKKHLLKPDEVCTVTVLKIDYDKKIVDLSRKRVTENDKDNVMIKFDICSKINKLMNECYIMHIRYHNDNSLSINDLMEDTIWKLYNEDMDYNTLYRTIIDDLNLILPSQVFPDDLATKIKNNVSQRITKNNMIMELMFALLIFEENAVAKIKEIFKTSLVECDKFEISILICSPPNYKIKIMGPCKSKAHECIEVIKKNIVENSKQYSGTLKFDELKIKEESDFKIRFLGHYDLQRIELA